MGIPSCPTPELVHHLLERTTRTGLASNGLVAGQTLTVLGNFARLGFVGNHGKAVTGLRRALKAEDFHRHRRTGFLHMLATVVDQCAHAAPFATGDEDVTRMQRTRLNQNGCNRTTATIELGFDDNAFSRTRRISLEIKNFSLQQNCFKQFVEVELVLGRHFDVENFTAHRFHKDVMLQQSSTNLLRIGSRLVDLVDRHDDRNTCRLGMVDRFNRLRHHAVIGSHHEDGNVGRLRTTGTHCSKGSVARRIDEGDLLAVLLDLISTDMLGDATGFARNNIGVTDRIKQRGLAVIDVTHNGHDRRTGNQRSLVVGNTEDAFFNVRFRNALDGMAEFFSNKLRHIGIDHVARLHHLALLHQVLDDIDRTFGHALCKFLKRNGFRNGHFTRNLFACFLHLRTLELFLTTTHRRKRTRTTFILKIAGDGQLATTAIIFGLDYFWRANFRLGRSTATGSSQATATTVVIVRCNSLAKLALRKRLARDRGSIGKAWRSRARATLLRTATLRRTIALRTTGLLRAIALRCRARIVATLGTGFGLRHTLGSLFPRPCGGHRPRP